MAQSAVRYAPYGEGILDHDTGEVLTVADFNARSTPFEKDQLGRDLTAASRMTNQEGEGGSTLLAMADEGNSDATDAPSPVRASPQSSQAAPSAPSTGNPSLEQFLEAARQDNPGVSDRAIKRYWAERYGEIDARSLPTLEEFIPAAKADNPGVSDRAIKAYWREQYGDFGAREKTPPERDFMRGAETAVKQIPQLAYGLEAGAGAVGEKIFGEGGMSTAIKEHGVKKFNEASKGIEKESRPSDSATTAWEMAKEGNPGALVDFLQYGLGYIAVQGVEMVATGGVGYAIGKLGAQGAAKVFAGKLIAKEAAKIASGQAVTEAITKQAVANVAGKIGQTTALAASAIGMEGGEIFGDLTSDAQKEGRTLSGEELAKAFGATVAAGSLEFVGDKIGFDLIMGKGIGRMADEATGLKGRAARGLIQGTAGAAVEGGTEFGQTLIEAAGKGKDPFSEASIREAVDSAALGVVGGTAIGAGSGALRGAQPPEPPKNEADIANTIIGASSVDDAIAKANAILKSAPVAESAVDAMRALRGRPESAIGPDFATGSEMGGYVPSTTNILPTSPLRALEALGAPAGSALDRITAPAPVDPETQQAVRTASDLEAQESALLEAKTPPSQLAEPLAPERTKQPFEPPILPTASAQDHPAIIPGQAFTPRQAPELTPRERIAQERERLVAMRQGAMAPTPAPNQPVAGPIPAVDRVLPSQIDKAYPSVESLVQTAIEKGFTVESPVFQEVVKAITKKTVLSDLTPVERQKLSAKLSSLTPAVAKAPAEPYVRQEKPAEFAAPVNEPLVTQPRSTLPPEQNAEMLLRAEKAQADLEATVSGGQAGFTQHFDSGPGQGEKTSFESANAQWYKDLTTGAKPMIQGDKKQSARERIEEAVAKIIQDEGSDRGAAVEKVKAVLLADREFNQTPWGRDLTSILQGDWPSWVENPTLPPHAAAPSREKMADALPSTEGRTTTPDGEAAIPLTPIQQEQAKLQTKKAKPKNQAPIIPSPIAEATNQQISSKEAPSFKGAEDTPLVLSDNLSNLVESEPFKSQGLHGLDVPTQRMMMMRVFDMAKDLKVRKAIIEAIPVDMVNDLRRQQLTPEMLFHDKAVFENQFVANAKDPIPIFSDVANAMVRAVSEIAKPPTKVVGPISSSYTSKNAVASDTGKGRQDVTPSSDVALGAEAASTASVPPNLSKPPAESKDKPPVRSDISPLQREKDKLQKKPKTEQPSERFRLLPLTTRTSFEEAYSGAERGDRPSFRLLKEWLYGHNKTLRAEFEQRTGVKLPKGLAATNAAVEEYFKKPSPVSAKPEVSTADVTQTDAEKATAEQIKTDAPINPKVQALVAALNKADIATLLSGDAYGDKYVYVDLASLNGLRTDALPHGWQLTLRSMPHMEHDLLGTPLSKGHADQTGNLERAGQRLRLARKGTTLVTATEATDLVNALKAGPDDKADAFSLTAQETPKAKAKGAEQLSIEVPPTQVAGQPIIGREVDTATASTEAPLFSKAAQEPEAEQTSLDSASSLRKELWEMTALEYARAHVPESIREKITKPQASFEAQHRKEIHAAIARGERIPAEVLADYPDLQPQGVTTDQVAPSRAEVAPIAPSQSPNEILAQALRGAADKIEGKAVTEKIQDVGEKVGGSRKDLAVRTGPTGTAKKADDGVPGWKKRYAVSQITKSARPGEEGKWVLLDTRQEDWQGRPKRLEQLFDSKEEAEAAIPLAAVSRNHRVYKIRGDDKYEIYRKIGDRKIVKVLDQVFDTEADAMRYMAVHAEEIIETKLNFGEEVLPRPDTVRRIGEDRRNGKNVKAEDFKETFNFRGVEFGNWNNQIERQEVMNHAYDGLLDLAETLGIPAKAIGLNGELALAFGARGHGLSGAKAHYERDYGVINLTKMEGAGSLAHEFFHATDHYFGRQEGKANRDRVENSRGDRVFKANLSTSDDYVSHGFRKKDSGVRAEVRTAYEAVIETMFSRAEQYVEDTAKVERFVGETKSDVVRALEGIRNGQYGGLSRQLDEKYYKRNNKPASAEQLAEFDGIANKIIAGEFLETTYKLTPKGNHPAFRNRLASGRWTNDALERLSAINKAVRGRSGFGSGEVRGPFDELRGYMNRYSERLKMLADAQKGTEKTKRIPTEYAREAKSIDQGRVESYWATPHEMAARAFAAYVEDKLKAQGKVNDFIVYGTNTAIATPWGWKRPYPTGAEREAINSAFNALFEVMETKETEQGLALYSEEAHADPPVEESSAVQAGLEGKTVTEALRWISDTAPSEHYRLIATRLSERIEELSRVGMRFDLRITHLNEQVPASLIGTRALTFRQFHSETTTIYLQGVDVTGYVGVSYETALHELLHAATQTALYVGNRQVAVGSQYRTLHHDLIQVSDAIIQHFNEKVRSGKPLNGFERAIYEGRNNALLNPDEVLAWGVTNRHMQSLLESIPYGNRTVWQRFVEAIRSFLGLSPRSDTALSEILRITDELLNAPVEQLMEMAKTLDLPTQINQYDGLANNQRSAPRIIGDAGRKYTPEQRKAMERTGSIVTPKTIQATVKDLWKDAGKKLAQGLVDQFRPVRDLSEQAYTLLRLSKSTTGAFEAFMHHGKLSLKDGAYDADTTGGVIESVFVPLGRESTDFLRWIAGNRAERLMSEGKEHLFTDDDIAAFKSLADDVTDFDYTLSNGTVTRDRTLIYKDALTKFNAFNKNVLDMAEESGLIDGASRHLWEHEFYVPFYRTEEDADVRGMNIKSGAVRQEAFKRLKGGDQQLNDLLANTLMNWAHLIDASAKNRAAKATLDAAEKVGIAHPATAGDKKTVWYMGRTERTIPKGTTYIEHGVEKVSDGTATIAEHGKVEYTVSDPYVLEAINSVAYAGLRGPAMDALSAMKHWLTVGVTASPFFKVRNLIRDSVQAIGTSGVSYNPIANIKKGIALTDHATQEYVSALAGGGLIRFGTMLEGNEASRVRQIIKQGSKDSHILDGEGKIRAFYDKYLEPAIAAYNELGNRGEEINRMTLYDTLIKQGKSHAHASLMARDLLDFSMHGTWQSIRFLTQVVPFLNARLQGLYKLGRAAKEDPARFAWVLGAVTLASLGLLAAYSDDDDWKKREFFDRENYWWFRFGGEAFRIPKPFEIGAIASLAEHGASLFFDKEMTPSRFTQRLLAITGNQLSMNPVPQAVKPIIDLYANHDSFTGRPIETMGMERLEPSQRFRLDTSLVARGMSTAGNAVTGDRFPSPVQIDHMARAYFGWLGSFVVGAGDMLARTVSNEPTRPTLDYWKVATGGMVAGLDGAHSRYVTQMYEQAKELEMAYGTWRHLQKEGKTAEAQSYREAHSDELSRYRRVEHAKSTTAKLNERMRMVERSNLSAEDKRDKIKAIRSQQDRLARQLAPQ